jgi:hypothetical protein
MIVKAHVPPPPPPTDPGETPLFRPPTRTVVKMGGAASPAPADPSAGPRKETARITAVPTPPSSSVEMKKTQPLVSMPAPIAPPMMPVTVSPEVNVTDRIPLPLCWILVGLSAVILIIQILNYIS